MTNARTLLLLSLAVASSSCSPPDSAEVTIAAPDPQLAVVQSGPDGPAMELTKDASAAERKPTTVQVRDVLLVQGGVVLGVSTFTATLNPTEAGTIPYLEKPETFFVAVSAGEFSIPNQTLTKALAGTPKEPDETRDERRERKKGARKQPLRSLHVSTAGDRLVLSGKLKFLGIPLEIEVRPFATEDGRLGLEIMNVEALGVPVERALADLGIHADDFTKKAEREQPGLQVVDNVIVVDVFHLVEVPRIEAEISGVSVVEDGLLIRVGESGGAFQDPASETVAEGITDDAVNYIDLRGGTARFGNATLHDVDVTMVDLDPTTPFVLGEGFHEQLLAGYVKVQDDMGVTVYVPDAPSGE